MRTLLRIAILILALVLVTDTNAAERPNFLIIMADDCTYNDLPLYGGKNAYTPNIDRLATEGMTFNRAYLSEAMCQPCRAELFSGQYPMQNGCAWNHSASRTSTKSLPHHLKPLGYRTGLAGKVHVKPASAFPFEKVGGFDHSCVRNPTHPHALEDVRDFMTRENGQPFCLVIALVEPHVPWVMGDPSRYPPAKLTLPPNLADTKLTRSDYSRYLAEITYMDGQVGEILQTLDESGHRNDTLVLFTSEQGSQFPGCKWTNWDTGLHTALIARWPGQVAPNIRTDALVQYADILPTLLEAAGSSPSSRQFDGSSFLRVLHGRSTTHRQYAYGMHNNIPEGPAYPIRTITDGEFRYIRNLTPNSIYIEKHLMGRTGDGKLNNPYWNSWIWDTAFSQRSYDLVERYMRRPPEQLYHTSEDRYEMNNLMQSGAYEEVRSTLSSELDRWMESQGDPGAPQDTQEAIQAARKGKHLYVPPE